LSVRAVILGYMGTVVPPRLLDLARFQAGVISRRQAVGSGLSSSAVASKVARGRWRKIYPGVYATFTGPVGRDARLWAVVLHAGTGAQLSHETAAELLRLTHEQCPLIHLTIPGERRVRPLAGIVVHRSSHMEQGWRFARGMPPHTLVEETILDLLDAAANLDDAVGWITRAFQRNLTNEVSLRRAMDARKRLRWRDYVEEAIPMAAGGTHSPLEYRYDRDVERAHSLPPARKQVPFTKPDGTRGFRDRCYDKYGLVVELDGKRYHDDRRDHDRRRDNAAAATTGATLRYDWDDVTRTQCKTAAQVYAALRKRGYTGRLKACSAACVALAESAGDLPASITRRSA
jgi:Transcriptional regulator, AbiEi antitoxin/Protein of unknown function (DUF559)